MRETADNILTNILPDSHLGARDMTILRSHVGPHVHTIGYMDVYIGKCWYLLVYESIWRCMKYTEVCGDI